MRVANVLRFVLLAATGTMIGLASTEALAQSTTQSIKLFSRIKYGPNQVGNCINFVKDHGPYQPCDLSYGNLGTGNELDWFNSSGGSGSRSVIKDLGQHSWSDRFDVPAVPPLAPLKPGEVRGVYIDNSGVRIVTTTANNGRNGGRGAGVSLDQNATGSATRDTSIPEPVELGQPSPSRKNMKPGTPMYVKAVAGHVYVIHVVDDENDFYALFRVDQLFRADSCVVSWKLIDAPSSAK